MEYGLMIDITCCGSDCYGQLNNPILSEFRVITDSLEIKKIITHKIIPEEPVTITAEIMSGETIDSIKGDKNSVDLLKYLNGAYNILTKCRDAGMFLIGYNHINYDLKILNDHFVKKLGKPEIEWKSEKIIDVADICRHILPYKEIGTFTMDACWYYINHSKFTDTHIPANDNPLAIDLLKYCKKDKSFSEIWKSINIDHEFIEFTWGKYKGMLFEDVYNKDRNYISWLTKNAKNNIPLMKRIKKQMDSEIPE